MKTKIIFLLLVAICFGKQLRFLDEVNNGRAVRTAAEIALEAKQVYDTVKDVLTATSPTMKFMGHVGMIIDAVATIVSTFGSSKSTVLQGLRKGEGFEKFNASLEFDFSLGYRLGKNNEGFEFFMQDMFEHAHSPEEYREAFNYTLEVGEMSNKRERFCEYNFAFNKEENKNNATNKDKMSYLNVLMYKYFDEKQHKSKFNAIIISAEARLKLFPDELIYETTERVAGGIRETVTLSSEFRDRDLTPDVIEGVISYFALKSITQFCNLAGIKISAIVTN